MARCTFLVRIVASDRWGLMSYFAYIIWSLIVRIEANELHQFCKQIRMAASRDVKSQDESRWVKMYKFVQLANQVNGGRWTWWALATERAGRMVKTIVLVDVWTARLKWIGQLRALVQPWHWPCTTSLQLALDWSSICEELADRALGDPWHHVCNGRRWVSWSLLEDLIWMFSQVAPCRFSWINFLHFWSLNCQLVFHTCAEMVLRHHVEVL